MIVSFLLQAADTVLKVLSSRVHCIFLNFQASIFVYGLHFTLAFSYFAGANLFGCKQKTEGIYSFNCLVVFIHKFI
jgi:hypothetical protein